MEVLKILTSHYLKYFFFENDMAKFRFIMMVVSRITLGLLTLLYIINFKKIK